MSKISLFNRKRIHELGRSKHPKNEKKDELIALQLQQMNKKAESANMLVDIPLSQLVPDPNQSRKIFNNIDTLAQSIQEKGIIQPIIVTPKKEDGCYHIIVGERRFRAAKVANLDTIPCILRHNADSDSDILILQLLENEQREKVSPFEEADALNELIEQRNENKAKVAQSLGRDPSWISIRLKLAQSSFSIRQLSQDGYIDDVRTLYELKKLEDELPEVAHDFIEKVRGNRVQGAFREVIKRAKDTWQRQNSTVHKTYQPKVINSVYCSQKGMFHFKSGKQNQTNTGHDYVFELSDNAIAELKEILAE